MGLLTQSSMGSRWEVCRLASLRWTQRESGKVYRPLVLWYWGAGDPLHKVPLAHAWGTVVGALAAGGWELVGVQHATNLPDGELVGHLRADVGLDEQEWQYVGADVVAYFKRRAQPDRPIDDVTV